VTPYQGFAVLLSVAAAFAYANHRWLRLPTTIGLMAMALIASLALVGLDRCGLVPLTATAGRVLQSIDFNEALFHGMLGALLFAAALHVDVPDLRKQWAAVATLAAGGTVLSTFVVAGLVFAAVRLAGFSGLSLGLSFGDCLLFGALISPTDPVAVLGVLKRVGVPKSVETQIAGESLFNDGVGVALFLTVLGEVSSGGRPTVHVAAALIARQAFGGAAVGLMTGWVTYRLLRSIDHYQTELLLTLALVFGGYELAESLHVSAPIASVVSGLLIGTKGRALAMSDVTREHIDTFWALVDEILNAILFVLMGFELIHVPLRATWVLLGLVAIPIVLAARALSVALPVWALGCRGSRNAGAGRGAHFAPGSIATLTWGGLRGGVSVALALSLPPSHSRDVLVVVTYAVVVFSVLVQGLTLGAVARRLGAAATVPPASVTPR
jgi:CPA1 family monovalent cation:H+ antiporter